MPFAKITLAVLLCLIAIRLAVDNTQASWSIFSELRNGEQVDLDAHSTRFLAQHKIAHLTQSDSYDIVLFGNSRSVQVGTANLDTGSCRFFNAAIPGQSFRNSVAMVERLVKLGHTFDTVILGLDNFLIQFAGNATAVPFWDRLMITKRDVHHVLTRGEITQIPHAIWRGLFAEHTALSTALDYRFIVQDISLLMTGSSSEMTVTDQIPGHYLADGHRRQLQPGPGSVHKPFPAQPNALRLNILQDDIERLSDMLPDDVDIVIFETPIVSAQQDVPAYVTTGRQAFMKVCKQHSVTCRLYDEASVSDVSDKFVDATHATSAFLGGYLATIAGNSNLRCFR